MCAGRIVKRREGLKEAASAGIEFPTTNVVRVNVGRLEETLQIYEDDRYGFLEKIPKVR